MTSDVKTYVASGPQPDGKVQRSVATTVPTASMGARVGNQKLQRLLLQAKLEVSHPGDPLEEEADRLAREGALADSMSGAQLAASPIGVQRACSRCEEELHRKAGAANAPVVDEKLEHDIRSLPNRGGASLPESAQPFARRLGIDPNSVGLHVDADLTGKTQSKGFTVGNQIVIHPKEYAPGTPRGDELIRHELVHVAQQGQAPALGGASSGLVQREPADTPCGPVELNSLQLYAGTIPGGPFKDERIAIPYDKIAPLPDPMKDFDAAESRATFEDPARLEQVYHDATRPVFAANRARAAWWVCSVVEPVARQIGEEHAARLFSLGCLTVKNCGIDYDVMLGNFSDQTASGLRLRALVMRGFVDKSRELNADLTIINNALLLLGGIGAARSALGGARPPPPAGLRPTPLPDVSIPGKTSAAEGGKAAPSPSTQPAPATQPAPHDTPAPDRGSRHQRPVGQQQQLTKKDPPKPPEAVPEHVEGDVTPDLRTRRPAPARATPEELERQYSKLHDAEKELKRLKRAEYDARVRADIDAHKANAPPTPPASRPRSTDRRVNPGPKVHVDKDYTQEVGDKGIKTQHPDASKQAAEKAAHAAADQDAAKREAAESRAHADALAEGVRRLEEKMQRLRDEIRRLERELDPGPDPEPDTDPDIDPHDE